MNPTKKPPGPPGLVAAFLDNIRTRPAAPALVWRDAEISYAELGALAEDAAAQLADLALPERATIGLLARKSPSAVAVILACLRTRRPFLLPPVDLGTPTLSALFDQAGCASVLTVAIDAAPGRVSMANQPRLAPETVAEQPVHPQPEDPAFLLTTSGSTGIPKIVPLSVGAVDRFVAWAAPTFDLGQGRTVFNHAPLNFDLCLLDIWATLAAGGRVVLIEADHATRAGQLADLLTRHRVNVVQGVPMLYTLLTTMDGRGSLLDVDRLIITGDHFPRAGLGRLTAMFPNARLYNVYGCTETNDSFVHEIEPTVGAGPIPIGGPVPGTHAVLVGPAGGVLTGTGVGELHVRTPFQTGGYLNPDLDADRFVTHREADGDHRYFRTGDLVHRGTDGTLTLRGRRDFQVKVRGTRVNVEQVEQALLAHPDVLEAVVLAPADPLAGHRLHAVVRRAPDSRSNSLTLRRHCAVALPTAAVPSAVEFADVPLPRTSTGKPDRRQIAATYLGDN